MKNALVWGLALVLWTLSLCACAGGEQVETTARPTKMSLEEELAEEEYVAALIATEGAGQTQAESRVSPYVKVSNGEQTYLAFWFPWNDEHALLPLDPIGASDQELVSCQLDPDVEISPGVLVSGVAVSPDECVLDQGALGNAAPIIKPRGYLDAGIQPGAINIIDLEGDYAENLAGVVRFTIENDLLGSDDLVLSLHRAHGPDGSYDDGPAPAAYTLPAEALGAAFEDEDLAEFEYVEDLIYALMRRFTWELPPGQEALELSAGDENWFVLLYTERGGETGMAYLQIKGVGAAKQE